MVLQLALQRHLLQRYLFQLSSRPLRTKSVTSALIAGLSDVVAQRLISGSYRNWKRTLAIALYGLAWNGPSAHYWQQLMEKLFPGNNNPAMVLYKTVLDQLTYGPLCNLLFMSFATVVLEGRTLQFLKLKVRRDFKLVQFNAWKVWPLAALINYQFVPLELRVLFINCVALCWSIFLLLQARSLGVQQLQQLQREHQEQLQAQAQAQAQEQEQHGDHLQQELQHREGQLVGGAAAAAGVHEKRA